MKAIVIDPAMCRGRPIFEGMRITVQTVLEFLAVGDSVHDVLGAYLSLRHADVLGSTSKMVSSPIYFSHVA